MREKSSLDEIRERFDQDVERFSQLDTGQVATIDAPLSLELLAQAAGAMNSEPKIVVDVGCGAGNLSLRLLRELKSAPAFHLIDLSPKMLDRAEQRLREAGATEVHTHCGDFRSEDLPGNCDLILAGAVLHHLRDDTDWERAFSRFHQLLRPGGSIWISDLVSHEIASTDKLMWSRYADYLTSVGGADYQQNVFDYIEKEDSPRSLSYQLKLLIDSGFSQIEVLHKNSCFATFGAVK